MKERSTLTARKSRRSPNAAPAAAPNALDPISTASPVNSEPSSRHELIATEAYLLAAQRGFTPGCELDDWLAAEALVESRLHSVPAGDRNG